MVDRYKHISDEQKRKSGAIFQNRVETTSKPLEKNGDDAAEIAKCYDASDSDDFEPPKIKELKSAFK